MPFRFLIAWAVMGLVPVSAWAQSPIFPLWATIPDVAENIAAQDRFTRALRLRGVMAPKPVQIELPPPPQTFELYRKAVGASPFDPPNRTRQAYTAAVTEVLAHGGAGLTRDELIDLFFRQAVAIQKASGAFPADIPAEAKRAYHRAAVLGMDRLPPAATADPLIQDSARQAISEVKARPRADMSVHTRPTATVFIDGKVYPFPAQARNLAYGEHLIRVEEKGFSPWSLVAIVSEPKFQIDMPPTLPLQFPRALAAQEARSQEAAFALLGELRLGEPYMINLSLIDAATAEIRASASIPIGGEEAPLITAVLRLTEEARLAMLQSRQPGKSPFPLNASLPPAPLPTHPSFQENPLEWARTHWPLLTAIGTTVGSAIVLGLLVASDNNSSARP